MIKNNKQKIIITGGAGLLGLGLLQTAPKNFSVIPTKSKSPIRNYSGFDFENLDITNAQNVKNLFNQIRPDTVIHAAGIGSVDYCEKNPDEAFLVNVEGTRNIINAAKKYGAKVVFTSSNAIFDGMDAPYNEAAKTNPLNYYGKTKIISEEDLTNSGIPYAIARLILMYGWNYKSERANPVTWLLNELEQKKEVKMVDDTYTNALYNLQAAEAIWRIIEQKRQGIYHLAGSQRVNRYEFALETAQQFGHDLSLIEAVPSDYFKGIAARMPDTTYDTAKMENELGIKPLSVSEGLEHMKQLRPND